MSDSSNVHLQKLHAAAFTYPAIDNHAHALLRPENCTDVPFEGLVSHLEGEGLLRDAPHTLACHRATQQLSKLYELAEGSSWEAVKAKRVHFDYNELCRRSFESSGIQCILLDDGLNMKEMLHDITWHDQFTQSPTRRVIRVETVAEVRGTVTLSKLQLDLQFVPPRIYLETSLQIIRNPNQPF